LALTDTSAVRGGAELLGSDPLDRAIAEVAGHVLDGKAGQRLPLPALRAPVPANLADRDPVKPRVGAAIGKVLTATPAECREERLLYDLLGEVGAEPRAGVAQDLVGMAVEDLAEATGLAKGLLDQVCVAGPGVTGSGVR
jgi:hypothetical protein